jgi:hypothetical protein
MLPLGYPQQSPVRLLPKASPEVRREPSRRDPIVRMALWVVVDASVRVGAERMGGSSIRVLRRTT